MKNSLSSRLYKACLHLYPYSYRSAYGKEMMQVFEELHTNAKTSSHGITLLWLSIFKDLSKSVVVQQWEYINKGEVMKSTQSTVINSNKIFALMAGAIAAILLIPLIAMQFTDDVNWSVSDFLIIGLLLFFMGSLFVLVARRIHKSSNRLVLGVVCAIIVLYIWAELAVGLFTSLGS